MAVYQTNFKGIAGDPWQMPGMQHQDIQNRQELGNITSHNKLPFANTLRAITGVLP